MPLDRDLAAYAVIGQRGDFFASLPYRDLFDHKQPLTYGLYWALDLVAPRKLGAIRLMAALVPAVAALAVYVALTPRWGRLRGALAAAVVTVCAAAPLVEGTDLNTEHVLELTGALPPLVALLAAGAPWAPVVVGVLVALAALTKAVGLFVAPAALLALLVGGRAAGRPWRATVVPFLAGVAVPALVVIAGFALFGALDDFWFANVTYNRLYVQGAPRSLLPPAGNEDIVRLVAVSAIVAAVALLTRHGRDLTLWVLVLWLAGAAAGAQLSSRGFPHYYAPLVVPCAAMLCAPLLRPGPSVPRGWAGAAWVATAVAVVVAVVPFARSVADMRGKSGSELSFELYGPQAAPWVVAHDVGQALDARAGEDDRLFVAGAEPMFYWTSGLEPASKFFYNRPAGIAPDRYWPAIQRDVCARPPRFLVLPAGTWAPEVACLMNAGYRPLMTKSTVVALEQ